MLVKQKQLAELTGYTEGGVSLACKRGTLIKDASGFYDLTLEKNYEWLCNVFAKQGREIPQEFFTLSKATPITENGKSKPNLNQAETKKQNGKEGEYKTLSGDEQKEVAQKTSLDENNYKHWRSRKEKEAYINQNLINEQLRGSLIKINPLATFLEGIVDGSRSQVINGIPGIIQTSLNIFKKGLEVDSDGKRKTEDTEIILSMIKVWTKDIEKIFTNTDKDLKSRIAQMKRDIRQAKK